MDCPVRFAVAGNHEAGYHSGGTADGTTDYGLTGNQIRAWLSNKYLRGGVKRASNTIYYAVDDQNEVVWIFISTPIAAWSTDQTNGIDAVAAANTGSYPLICFCHYSVDSSNGNPWSKVSDALDYIVTTKGQTVIAWIGGHIHADWSAVYNGTLIVACLQSGIVSSNPSQDGTTYYHTLGTVSESAVSVFTVDKTSGKLFLTRFGAGVDREFNYNTTSGTVGPVTGE